MAAEILDIGTGVANSEDVVIASGEELTVALKSAVGPKVTPGAQVMVLLKDDSGEYFEIGRLSSLKPAFVIAAAGSYRFSRIANGSACGVFSG